MPLFVAAFLAALIGLIAAGVGLVFATSDMSDHMASGRRYATYDPEFIALGVSVTPVIGQILTFVVAPSMIVLSVAMVFRGLRVRKLNIDSDSNTD